MTALLVLAIVIIIILIIVLPVCLTGDRCGRHSSSAGKRNAFAVLAGQSSGFRTYVRV